MPNLPTRDYRFYAGIDPGFSGAIGLMNAAGTMVKVWNMPTREGTGKGGKEIDLEVLRGIFSYLARLPDCCVGLEWPTTRPGEGAERSERFGRGKGYLEAFAFLKRLEYFKLAPHLWKGRLGLDGKDIPGANEGAARMFEGFYPERATLIRGPRGGLLDGIMDALLICHFLRTHGTTGFKSVAEKFGKGSPEMMAMILGGKKRRRCTG